MQTRLREKAEIAFIGTSVYPEPAGDVPDEMKGRTTFWQVVRSGNLERTYLYAGSFLFRNDVGKWYNFDPRWAQLRSLPRVGMEKELDALMEEALET